MDLVAENQSFLFIYGFLWSISNICLVNIEIHYHFEGCVIYVAYPHEICYDWWLIFIVLNLIGDRIFLQSEPQNSIAYHQTIV